jgi:hypothetical protein
MKNKFLLLSPAWFKGSWIAMLMVAVMTGLLLAIGRSVLGEGVIALLYLIPIAWITTRWGQGVGIVSAIVSALAFDYFFIPPFYSFTVGNLEGWLIIFIFLAVSVVVVGQIQSLINKSRMHEREAIIVYELVSSLSTLTSRESIAQTLSPAIQQSFQCKQVRVSLYQKDEFLPVIYGVSCGEAMKGKPDLILAIDSGQKFAGDISIWRGDLPLPAENDWLIQSFIRQTALALERVEKNASASASPALSTVTSYQ